MPSLSNLPPEVIQNYLFRYLTASERGKLEQTNKRFRDLSRDYLFEELKRNFGILPGKFKKININAQEAIRLLYVYLYRCSKVFSDLEMQVIIQAINKRNKENIEETLVICQEIKITMLKKKIRENRVLFFKKIEQSLYPWIPDCLLYIVEMLVIGSPVILVFCSIILILAVAGLTPSCSIVNLGAFTLFFAIIVFGLLLCHSLILLVEKLKSASEYSHLKQLKIFFESKRTNQFETFLEASFSCD